MRPEQIKASLVGRKSKDPEVSFITEDCSFGTFGDVFPGAVVRISALCLRNSDDTCVFSAKAEKTHALDRGSPLAQIIFFRIISLGLYGLHAYVAPRRP